MSRLENNGLPEIALGLSEAVSMEVLSGLGRKPSLHSCLSSLGCSVDALDERTSDLRVGRVYYGNEFCERLIPTRKELEAVLVCAGDTKIELTLVTPMLTDVGRSRIMELLPMLPDGSEVVVNDWGALHCLRSYFKELVPILGRMLNKMIKDPRLSSDKWMRLHPYEGEADHFLSFMGRYGVNQMEMDVPPFAIPEQFKSASMKLGVYLPYGYTVKGRMCRIGSLELNTDNKFQAAHACNKECLTYWATTSRNGNGTEADLYSFQRGNTQFYRHSRHMSDSLWIAVDKGWVQRLIFAGDWNENNSSIQ